MAEAKHLNDDSWVFKIDSKAHVIDIDIII